MPEEIIRPPELEFTSGQELLSVSIVKQTIDLCKNIMLS